MNWKLDKRKRLVALAAVLLIGTVGVVTALRQVKPEDRINAFTLGSPGVTVVEPGVDPEQVPWGNNTKPVIAVNSGDIPVVVRVLVVPRVELPGGEQLALLYGESENGVIRYGNIQLHLEEGYEAYWSKGSDGYYYYRQVLPPGGETSRLLAGVTLHEEAKNKDVESWNVEVEVIADCLQSGGNAPQEWGITLEGSLCLFSWETE